MRGMRCCSVHSILNQTESYILAGSHQLILAMALLAAESLTGASDFSVTQGLLLPSLVSLGTQSLETWVITPLVQGETTRLHPIVVIVVLLVGGSLLGIVGLILAVPVTASLRTLWLELAVPRWRKWAASH